MNRPRLHVVALAHLDTQWRWTVRETVESYLPATVEANEDRFERFPGYVLSFEGTLRYRLLAEHHPALFDTVRRRIAEGRWHVAGAAVEAFDTLLPSPESIARQVLYGRQWLRRELGADSVDLFLPDCFGFPITLPTLARHMGLLGFSTQKLRRGPLMRSAFGIPFAYGRWQGADGSELLAALDPGEYSGSIEGDLTRDEQALADARAGSQGGAPAIGLRYVGIGDRGGAVAAPTIDRLEAALVGDGPLEVRHGGSDRIFLETSSDERAALPTYRGELLLRLHGTGCYTAKAALKRWNRRVEGMARIAETAVVAALSAGHRPPLRRLESAWHRLLAHQMHDDLTGTAIPAAYDFSFDDLGLAANEFEEIALDALARIATAPADSESSELLVAVATVAAPHADLVEVAECPPGACAVIDADGFEHPIQLLEGGAGTTPALIPVRSRGAGLEPLRWLDRPPVTKRPADGVEATNDSLESRRYRLELDGAGALRRVYDKRLDRDLLASPVSLELLPDRSPKYPAWEILWSDVSSDPLARVDRLRDLAVVERGPLRAALRVERAASGVTVRETWRLAADELGEIVQVAVEIDWRRRSSLLKAAFRLAAANPTATYDTGLGAIERPLASEALYEVPAQHWAAIEDASGEFAVVLFADCRHGWDHPEPGVLRSTWIHAPRASWKWRHQATQDFGRHRFRMGLAGLGGGELAAGGAAALADRFVHRPRLFRVANGGADGGALRRKLIDLAPPLRLLALKPTESGEAALLRLANPSREDRPVTLRSELPELSRPFLVDGMEEPQGAGADAGERLRAPAQGVVALRSSPLARSAEAVAESIPVPLPWTAVAWSPNGERRSGGGFDGRGHFLPLEELPEQLDETAVPFDLTHIRARRADVVISAGQLLELPPECAELWLLAASVGGDLAVDLAIDGHSHRLVAPDWRRPLLRGNRIAGPPFARRPEAGSFRRLPTAWSCGHLHDRAGSDLAVTRATLFALQVPVRGARQVRLPSAPALRIVAATRVRRPARPVLDAEPAPHP